MAQNVKWQFFLGAALDNVMHPGPGKPPPGRPHPKCSLIAPISILWQILKDGLPLLVREKPEEMRSKMNKNTTWEVSQSPGRSPVLVAVAAGIGEVPLGNSTEPSFGSLPSA